MDLTDVDNLKIALQLAGLKASKGLGQHFLIDRPSLDLVMSAGELRPSDTVLEIGPGLGVMTSPLTKTVAQVVAVEMDPKLAKLLRRDQPANLEVVTGDITRFDLARLPHDYKVVANIPYYLTSNLLRLLLEAENPPIQMSLLIQKEVAARVVAAPGQMSVLAVSVQYYAKAQIIGLVERHKFWPPPKVDSAVLQLKRRTAPAFAADRSQLFRLVKAGFGEKRKLLKNSLAGGFNITVERAEAMIKQAQLPALVRAQEMSLPQWERLYRVADQASLW